MRRLTNTAGMRLPRRNRQRQWDEVPHQHEQQKKSGSQAMHSSGSTGVSPVVASAASITKSRAVANRRHEWLSSNEGVSSNLVPHFWLILREVGIFASQVRDLDPLV
jgi:hypothetical protein